jgi:predicted glutamine amidotransferase
MCKLAAYTNFEKTVPATIGMKINKAIQHLWYINSYGQVDGSGIMYMDKDGSYGYLKDALPSTIMLQLTSFADIKNDLYEFPFVAAHTRYSTVGGNTWENTHPFEIGDILGMQNGTISSTCSHKDLVLGHKSPYAVDSASVLWAIDKQGVQKTFQYYEGEGVFMYLDLRARTFNIVKNKHRTLNRAKLAGYNVYLYSTDAAALQLVCDRANLLIEPVTPVPDGVLITYSIDGTETLTPTVIKETIYNHSYGTWAGKTIPATGNSYKPKQPPQILELPHKKPVQSSTYDYLDDEDLYLDIYDDERKYDPNPYITTCDCCGSPIFEKDTFFADTSDIIASTAVSCSTCVKELEEMTGKKLTKVTNTKGTYTC